MKNWAIAAMGKSSMRSNLGGTPASSLGVAADCRGRAGRVASMLLLVIVAGCGKGPNLVPVRGTVLVDGQPLGLGRIQFAPMATGDNVNPGRPAVGSILADGTFTLGTETDDDGAIVGKHRVTIYTQKPKKSDGGNDVAARKSSVPPFQVLRLIDRDFTVDENGENNFVIELTSDYIRKFGEGDD